MTSPINVPPTILVTGGRGRIGRLLVAVLRDRGQRVVSLARVHGDEMHPDDVTVELTQPSAVQDAVANAGAQTIVHLASMLRGEDLEAVNERIDLAVASAARLIGVRRVVLTSSGAVYGVAAESARSEESSLDVKSPYARSKVRTEEIFRSLVENDPSASVMMLRVFNVAGPSFADSLVQKLLHADAAHPVALIQPDRFVRDYIHQEDLVDVLCAAVEYDVPGTHVVNAGAGVPVSTKILLERLAVDRSAYDEVDGDSSYNWADIAELVSRFGVHPRAAPDRSWA